MNVRKAFLYGAYSLTLLLFWGVSFSPEGRVWGMSWWAYYGTWLPWTMLAVGVLMGLLVLLIPRTAGLTLQPIEGGGR